MFESVISRPAYTVLSELTGEARPDVALAVALRDLVRLRHEAARDRIAAFEQKYGMTFAEFEKAWNAGEVADRYSWPVEKDYWEWEAAVTDKARLEELQERLV